MIPNLILFDDTAARENLLPLSFTRPLSHMRIGITTIEEKWKLALAPAHVSYFCGVEYLEEKFPTEADHDDNLFVAGNMIPSDPIVELIKTLQPNQAIKADHDDTLVAYRGSLDNFRNGDFAEILHTDSHPVTIKMLYELFMLNDPILRTDFALITARRKSQPLSSTNTVIGDPGLVFLEEGACVEGATINTTKGPVYVGEHAEIMEGCCLRGPIAMLPHAVANMGTKIYGATTLGPFCKVGGELNNVVMIGYSNKAHDGFLGNAVIGKWCNLGAGCVASNLKNDYTEIKLWNYPKHRFLKTGLQFCGLIMGDHSKAGINTMFNTATVVGVGCNIHGSGFPRNFVPSFSEGSTAGFSDVPLSKFFDIARRMAARRGETLTDADMRMFEAINAIAETYK